MEENEDIESEGNEDVVIDVPFNPNNIKVKPLSYSIGQIIQDMRDGNINLDTVFQRLPNLWDNTKKSRLIESLMLNLPIPSFYFNEKEENNWEVIDGLQRISTLKSFIIDKTFTLQNLEFLKEFNNNKYEQLPNSLQKRIARFQVTIYIIERGTPNEVKFNIFKRINQGGLILKPQEIRHALNQGIPAEVIADLTRGSIDDISESDSKKKQKDPNKSITELNATPEGNAFILATDKKVPTARMEDRDFANRFIAFYLIPYEEYQPDLDSFLNKGMEKIRELTTNQITKLKDDFRNSMILAFNIFKQDAFRKRMNKDDNRKPINKALFEVLSVCFAKLDDVERSILLNKELIFKEKLMELNNMPDGKFLRSISQGTAQKESVIQRFTDIQRIIRETITNDKSIPSN